LPQFSRYPDSAGGAVPDTSPGLRSNSGRTCMCWFQAGASPGRQVWEWLVWWRWGPVWRRWSLGSEPGRRVSVPALCAEV